MVQPGRGLVDLGRLEVQRITLSAHIIPVGVTVTYSRQFRRCGKPGCGKCAGGGRGHGPYWYASGTWRAIAIRATWAAPLPSGWQARQGTADHTRSPRTLPAVWPGRPRRRTGRIWSPARSLGTDAGRLCGLAAWRAYPGRAVELNAGQEHWLVLPLALRTRRHCTQGRSAEWLWPNADPEISGRNLRQALYQARQALTSSGSAARAGSCRRQDGDLLVLPPRPPEGQRSEDVGAAA